jgi:hypothetical protein
VTLATAGCLACSGLPRDDSGNKRDARHFLASKALNRAPPRGSTMTYALYVILTAMATKFPSRSSGIGRASGERRGPVAHTQSHERQSQRPLAVDILTALRPVNISLGEHSRLSNEVRNAGVIRSPRCRSARLSLAPGVPADVAEIHTFAQSPTSRAAASAKNAERVK